MSSRDAMPLQDRTAFQRDLLATVAGLSEPNGLEVKRAMEAEYDDRVLHGRVYPNLDELVEDGLVEKREVDGRSNAYALTRSGEAALVGHVEWLVGQLEA